MLNQLNHLGASKACHLNNNKKNFFNIYSFLRARDSANSGGAEGEGDTESEAGSRP